MAADFVHEYLAALAGNPNVMTGEVAAATLPEGCWSARNRGLQPSGRVTRTTLPISSTEDSMRRQQYSWGLLVAAALAVAFLSWLARSGVATAMIGSPAGRGLGQVRQR